MVATNGEFYNRPVWPGAVFLERERLLLRRGLYVCHARETAPHASPIPQAYIALTRGLSLRVEAWTEETSAGERRCVPARDERKRGCTWEPSERRVELRPGQLALVMSDYQRQLEGEGILAISYLLPDSVEGQWALTRGDYEVGVAVVTPPEREMDYVLGQLAALHRDPAAARDAAAVEVSDSIAALWAPAPGARAALDPVAAAVVMAVRKRCRLRRLQCELNARIVLCNLADYIGTGQKKLEETFRKHCKTSVCSFIRFLRAASAMEFYAREQRAALGVGREVSVTMTDLAQEVHYLDEAHFSNRFRGFHGIAPVMFYPNTYFRLIDDAVGLSAAA
ncbi:MAG TPA: helix-turn-helix domain-containing protein [Pyrinomonadaceae bacterium]|nr:helix-turn-helix domain-containing protein [Pyrinomonadaceae bacterium]